MNALLSALVTAVAAVGLSMSAHANPGVEAINYSLAIGIPAAMAVVGWATFSMPVNR